MSANTSIEWTDYTFNPWWGCLKVSRGCDNCYALMLARRYGHNVWGPAKTTPRRTFGEKHWSQPLKWNRDAEKAGVHRRVFCASMADVFEHHPTANAERPKLWALIRATPWLDWQLLTKRPDNIAAMIPDDWGEGYPNVWLGTSIEDPSVVWRFDALRAVPAAVHFLSLEPLLADVARALRDRFTGFGPNDTWWVIVGGESGPGARPMDVQWVRAILDICSEFGVWPFVKQLGAVPMEPEADWSARRPTRLLNARNWDRVPEGFVPLKLNDSKGGDMDLWPADLRVREFPAVAHV